LGIEILLLLLLLQKASIWNVSSQVLQLQTTLVQLSLAPLSLVMLLMVPPVLLQLLLLVLLPVLLRCLELMTLSVPLLWPLRRSPSQRPSPERPLWQRRRGGGFGREDPSL
jgi:hypothetical protein